MDADTVDAPVAPDPLNTARVKGAGSWDAAMSRDHAERDALTTPPQIPTNTEAAKTWMNQPFGPGLPKAD